MVSVVVGRLRDDLPGPTLLLRAPPGWLQATRHRAAVQPIEEVDPRAQQLDDLLGGLLETMAAEVAD